MRRKLKAMPIINVQMIKGRPPEKIEELIKNLTKTTAKTLDAPIENVRVLVTEIPDTHWGISGKSVSEKRK